MTLPKITSPIYDLTLPISKEKIKFVPFKVKEQKMLLMVLESKGDRDFLMTNIKQILQNCIVSNTKIDHLPIVDIEYYFLNLRARSVSEQVDSFYKCNRTIETENDDGEKEESECGNMMKLSINLMDIQVDTKDYKDVIALNSKIGVKFKFPDFDYIDKLSEISLSSEVIFDVIYNCVEYIYDEDNLYYASEVPKEELIEFFDSLSLDQFKLIENHFLNLPKLEKDYKLPCKKCGFVHDIHVEGIESFFD
jgi:hypothetical protein